MISLPEKELITIFSNDMNQSGWCVLNASAHAIIFACVHACECVKECDRGRDRTRMPGNRQSHMGSFARLLFPS